MVWLPVFPVAIFAFVPKIPQLAMDYNLNGAFG